MVIDSLLSKLKSTNNPSVIGLDPTIESIPEFLAKKYVAEYGNSPAAVAYSFLEFNKAIIDHIYDVVPAIKLQSACYELYGYEGIKAFESTIKYAKGKDLLVIDDSKRNDIGSTARLYALGHLGAPPLFSDQKHDNLGSDFLTVTPYLGSDGITPFIETCKTNDKGLFILCKTSNPSSAEFQDLYSDNKRIYEIVADMIASFSNEYRNSTNYSPIGAVVGATQSEAAKMLRSLMPNSFFLVPGYGAQGASGKDLRCFFNRDGLGALINSSRGIINSWNMGSNKGLKNSGERHAEIARQACLIMRQDIVSNIS